MKKVLAVVEDDPKMTQLVTIALRSDPRIEVRGSVRDAAQAIQKAREIQPDLVILDHMIEGDVPGLQAAPKIKDVAPRCKILLFTAFELSREVRKEPAVDAYLRKDRITDLLPTVCELLGLEPL